MTPGEKAAAGNRALVLVLMLGAVVVGVLMYFYGPKPSEGGAVRAIGDSAERREARAYLRGFFEPGPDGLRLRASPPEAAPPALAVGLMSHVDAYGDAERACLEATRFLNAAPAQNAVELEQRAAAENGAVCADATGRAAALAFYCVETKRYGGRDPVIRAYGLAEKVALGPLGGLTDHCAGY